MPLPKPSTNMDWTDGAAAKVVEPSAGKKLLGWIALERPPFEFMNFLFFNTDEWVKYLESVTDEQDAKIAAIVDAGGSGTHTDLQAAHDSAGVVAGSKIIIVSDLVVATTISLSKPDIEYEMRPGFKFRRDGAAPAGLTALSIIATADRNRFFGLGFGGTTFEFDEVGDKCLLLDIGADDCLFFNNFFEAANTENFDTGSNTSFINLAQVEK